MKNINELIGIVKGVNYDGVINSEEIDYLKAWVNKNRNLAYESKQIGFIRLVEDVISDGIITDDEREKMLGYCKMFLNESPEYGSKVYELYGIAEGIVSDGVVNDEEVIHLKQWMEKYGEYVRQDNNARELCDEVDKILKDGIITEDEQEVLLNLISYRICDAQFNTKLSYLTKLVNERKNIGIELIGLLDDESSIQKIHERAESSLKRAFNSYSGTYVPEKEVVFISLVLIAMLHYDGNYYENVETTYSFIYSRYSTQRIEGLIRNILSSYMLSDKGKSIYTRKIDVALMNSIVPSKFLKSFFEFIYDIYKLNFGYEISDNMYEEFEFVFEGLRSNMLSQGDEIEVSVTKKTYKLINATKRLISDPRQVDAAIRLSTIIVKLIDNYIWNKNTMVYNPYLKQGFEEWVKTIEVEKNLTRNRNANSALRSRWEPKYILDGNSIYLIPPVHRVKAIYDYRDIYIRVKNGDKVLYDYILPNIRDIIGGYEVSIDKIKIDDPLGDVTYYLMAGNEVIYSSKDKLKKDFLVFDEKGYEVKNNKDYEGIAIFCTKNVEKSLASYYKGKDYVLSTKSITIGDYVYISGIVFNFSSFIKSGISGDIHNKCNVISENKESLTVYNKIDCLFFECENKQSQILDIVINGKHTKLTDFKHTVIRREGITKYIVKLDGLKDDVYFLDIYSLSSGKKENLYSEKFVLDSKLKYESEILDKGVYLVAVSSDLLDVDIIKEVYVSELDENMVTFTNKGKNYIYHLPFDFNIYRIDNNGWQSKTDSLWIGDLRPNSNMDLYAKDFDYVSVYSHEGKCIDEKVIPIKKGLYTRLFVGFLVSYKSSCDFVNLIFIKDEKAVDVMRVYNKCIMDVENTFINYDPISKDLYIVPKYFGIGNVFVNILDEENNVVKSVKKLVNGEKIVINDLDSFKDYTVAFYEKPKGLSVKKERLLHSTETKFYARKDFEGKSFKIKSVCYEKYVKGKFMRKRSDVVNAYLRVEKMIEEDQFIVRLYKYSEKKAYWYSALNPVDMTVLGDFIDDHIDVELCVEGDGLLFDIKNRRILNTLENANAIDIYTCRLTVK